MNKYFKSSLLGSVLTIILTGNVSCQNNIISIRPINFSMGLYGLAYERVVLKQFSVGVYIDYMSSNFGVGKYNFSGNGFGFIPEVRLYLSPLNVVSGSPEGIFIGGYVPLRYVNGTFKVKDNLSAFVSSGYNPSGYVEAKSEKLLTGFGGMIGYHLILAKIISLEFILGLAYTNGYLDEKYHVKFKPDDANATTQAQSDLAVAISNPNGYNSSTGTFEYTIPDAAKTFSQFIPRFGINLGIGF